MLKKKKKKKEERIGRVIKEWVKELGSFSLGKEQQEGKHDNSLPAHKHLL